MVHLANLTIIIIISRQACVNWGARHYYVTEHNLQQLINQLTHSHYLTRYYNRNISLKNITIQDSISDHFLDNFTSALIRKKNKERTLKTFRYTNSHHLLHQTMPSASTIHKYKIPTLLSEIQNIINCHALPQTKYKQITFYTC